MDALAVAAMWVRYWAYDWAGGNVGLFVALHDAFPAGWLWLPQALSWWGSYWGAPAAVAALVLWGIVRPAARRAVRPAVVNFLAAFALAMSATAVAKSTLAFPRPFIVLGESVYRAAAAPDSRFTLPSGHATYMGVLVAATWPLLAWPARAALLLFAVAVGWSRIVLGAHFPADVLAGFAVGVLSVAAARVAARLLAPNFVSART